MHRFGSWLRRSSLWSVNFNLKQDVTADTAYAEYIVDPVTLPGQQELRALWVNESLPR